VVLAHPTPAAQGGQFVSRPLDHDVPAAAERGRMADRPGQTMALRPQSAAPAAAMPQAADVQQMAARVYDVILERLRREKRIRGG
jgi:hypothetical protein